jgi:broad specificity phosphatase PhoE
VSTIRVHWIRHGKIASHKGDVPLTDEGVAQAREKGRSLARDLSPNEIVHFMHAPTLRTRQTAEEIRASMARTLGNVSDVDLLQVDEQWAIRNPDIFVAGQRVELVSSAEALAEQISTQPVAPETLSNHPFFREFWASPDRIGYWVGHPDPPGEDALALARRQMTFAMSLPDVHEDRPVRYVLSTHSPVLRAISLCYLGEDPGEPEYLEPVNLILPKGEPPEIRFRSLRTRLPDTRPVKGVPR